MGVEKGEIVALRSNQNVIEVPTRQQFAELAIQSRIGFGHIAGNGLQRSSVRGVIA